MRLRRNYEHDVLILHKPSNHNISLKRTGRYQFRNSLERHDMNETTSGSAQLAALLSVLSKQVSAVYTNTEAGECARRYPREPFSEDIMDGDEVAEQEDVSGDVHDRRLW